MRAEQVHVAPPQKRRPRGRARACLRGCSKADVEASGLAGQHDTCFVLHRRRVDFDDLDAGGARQRIFIGIEEVQVQQKQLVAGLRGPRTVGQHQGLRAHARRVIDGLTNALSHSTVAVGCVDRTDHQDRVVGADRRNRADRADPHFRRDRQPNAQVLLRARRELPRVRDQCGVTVGIGPGVGRVVMCHVGSAGGHQQSGGEEVVHGERHCDRRAASGH